MHGDTIGCMVRQLKDDGRLAIVPVGTHSARFSEGARVTIFVDDLEQGFYTGTVLPLLASGHRYGDEVDTQGVGWEHVEVRVVRGSGHVINRDDHDGFMRALDGWI